MAIAEQVTVAPARPDHQADGQGGAPTRRPRAGFMQQLRRTAARARNILTYHLPTLVKVEVIRRMPKAYGRLSIKPLYAGLNITDNCNMRCIMCNSWRAVSRGEFTTEEWKGVLRQLKREGVRYIGFAGGEPLLRKDLPELIRAAAALGLHTEITTSGYLLDRAKADALFGAGLQSVVISIDGVGPEYEAIRGREWQRVEQACEILAQAKRDGAVLVTIGFVLMKPTLDHVESVKALSARLGMPLTISLLDAASYLFDLDSNVDQMWIRDDGAKGKLRQVQQGLVKSLEAGTLRGTNYAAVEWIGNYFNDPRQAKLPCAVSQTRILIDSHGKVFGGCWALGDYGCLRQQPLRDILRSAAYRAAHRKMFMKECPGCSCGYKVSLSLSVPMRLRQLRLRWSKRLRREVFGLDG